jgi:hypothetical protein
MKKFLLIVLVLSTLSITGFSQKDYSVAVTGGYDYNMNHLIGLGLENNTNSTPDFNIGADFSFLMGDKLRLRADIRYSNLSFNEPYTSSNIYPKDAVRFIYAFNNLDITPRVDYRILKINKFDLYASAGLKFEFLLYKFELVELADGDFDTSDTFKYATTGTNVGAVGGLIFKYNITPKFGVLLAPDYTYFFDYFVPDRNDYHDRQTSYWFNKHYLQRLNMNVGVEWTF